MSSTLHNHKVYGYIFIPTNKFVYVGQTSRTLKERAGSNGCMYGQTTYFGLAIRQHGWQNFRGVVLKDNLTKEEANYWEEFYTKEKDTLYPNGYNNSAGRRFSEETKKKLSELMKGKGVGKHLSGETRRKIRESRIGQTSGMKGRHHTEGVKKKLSEAHKGQIAWNKNKHGYLSEEMKQRISKSQKGNQHAKGYQFTEEQRRDLSKKLKEYYSTHESPTKGRKQTEEEKKKRSEAIKVLKWFNDGTTNVRRTECPEGFRPGKISLNHNN